MYKDILAEISLKFGNYLSKSDAYECIKGFIFDGSIFKLDLKEFIEILDIIDLEVRELLIKSSSKGDIEVINYLFSLKDKACSDSFLYNRYTLLNSFIKAAENGHTDILQYILDRINDKKFQNIIIHSSGNSPFKLAVINGHLNTVKYIAWLTDLKEVDYLIHSIDNDYKYITQSIKNGHIETIRYLIELCEDNDLKQNMINRCKEIFFTSAVENGHIEIVRFLLKLVLTSKGAKKMVLDRYDLREILGDGVEAVLSVGFGVSFRIALNRGHEEVVKYLLNSTLSKKKWDKIINSEDNSFYIEAANSGKIELLNEILNYTKDEGFKEEMILICRSISFRDAAKNGKIEVLNKLLEQSKDQNEKNAIIHFNGNNPFLNAAFSGNLEVMKYLLEIAQDSDKREEMLHCNNEEPFRLACSSGNFEVIKYFLDLEQDKEKKEEIIHRDSDILFRFIVMSGKLDLVKYFIELTPDPEKRDKMIHSNCDEAFRVSAANGFIDIMKYLAQLTSDPVKIKQMIKADNYACLRYAFSKGQLNVLKYLHDIGGEDVTNEMSDSKYEYLSINNGQSQSIIYNITKILKYDIIKYSMENLKELNECQFLILSDKDFMSFLLEQAYELIKSNSFESFDDLFTVYFLDIGICDGFNELIDLFFKSLDNNNILKLKKDFINEKQDIVGSLVGSLIDLSLRNNNLEAVKCMLGFFNAKSDYFNRFVSSRLYHFAYEKNTLATFKYLFSFDINIETKSKAINEYFKVVYLPSGFVNYNIDFSSVKYLISLTDEMHANKRIEIMHNAFGNAFYKGSLDTMIHILKLEPRNHEGIINSKFNLNYNLPYTPLYTSNVVDFAEKIKHICILSPFHDWTNEFAELKPRYINIEQEIKPYLGINIKSLKNFATCCKNLFSAVSNVNPNNIEKSSFFNLPVEIIYKIAGYVAEVEIEDYVRIKSSISAFTYNEVNYNSEFKGFISRYEELLEAVSWNNNGDIVSKDKEAEVETSQYNRLASVLGPLLGSMNELINNGLNYHWEIGEALNRQINSVGDSSDMEGDQG